MFDAFVLLYLLKPLRPPVQIVWARVVESDKPVFTLLLGSAGAAAEGLHALFRLL
jgi:hypothetical protein